MPLENDTLKIKTIQTLQNNAKNNVINNEFDLLYVEKTNEYSGTYHILGGVLSPLSGKDAESLNINELIHRVSQGNIQEVILALNPDTEGETTSLYIAKLLKSSRVPCLRPLSISWTKGAP